jgi:hypothetical protein
MPLYKYLRLSKISTKKQLMSVRNLLIVTLFFAFTSRTIAQVSLDNSQFPSQQQWKKLATPNFDIIFPQENEQEAQRVANISELALKSNQKTLVAPKFFRIPIVLSNQTVISNGYVQSAPRKSEWFVTPPQDGFAGTNEWYNELALHEIRHMVQYMRHNVGFTKVASYLAGEFGSEIFSFFSTPTWFWEGDAVCSETALSESGRGRLPFFSRDYRALALEGKRYSFNKVALRSYRDFMPNHYYFGYYMTSFLRSKHGALTWDKVIDFSARHAYNGVYAFDKGVKLLNGGAGLRGVYHEMMDTLGARTRAQVKDLVLTPYTAISPTVSYRTSYINPVVTKDGRIIAGKNGMKDAFQLVLLGKGTEKHLTYLNTNDEYKLSVSDSNKIAWTEVQNSSRWGLQNYSVIAKYDLNTNKKTYLTTQSKYVAANISHDGKTIAAIEFLPNRKCQIHLLDAKNGAVLKQIPNVENTHLYNMAWSENDQEIAFCRVTNTKGVALAVYNLPKDTLQDVLPPSNEAISAPSFMGKYLLYQSAYSGIDNIYALDRTNQQRYQVTCSKLGATNPEVSRDSTTLFYSEFESTKGDRIVSTPLVPANWKPLIDTKVRFLNFHDPIVAQERGNILNDEIIPTKTYQTTPFSTVGTGLRFHSWGILPTGNGAEAFAQANDWFNTWSVRPNVSYNFNENRAGYGVDAEYSKLYPILSLSAGINNRAVQDTINRVPTLDTWQEQYAKVGIGLPFDFSQGNYSTKLTTKMTIGYSHINGKERLGTPTTIGNGNFIPITYRATFNNQHKSGSYSDFMPLFQQQINLNYTHTPIASDYKGEQFSIDGKLIFPGLAKQHRFGVSAAYESQPSGGYRFATNQLFPRGYEPIALNELYKISANYAFPIAYFDLGIDYALNFKALRANLFYDYGGGKATSNKKTYQYQSTGAEILTELNIMQLTFPITLGYRLNYLIPEKKLGLGDFIVGFGF